MYASILVETMPSRELMRRTRPAWAILCWTLALAAWSLSGQTPPAAAAPVRILFIGNSYVYVNKLPLALAKLAASAVDPVRIETSEVVVGGATLQQHWAKGDALEAIRKGVWDWVVLQEQSSLGGRSTGADGVALPGPPERFYEFARLFNAEIRKTKAHTLLYLTWANEQAPEGQARLTEAYRSLARELSATLAPVGIAFQNARTGNSALSLYRSDHSHPSPAGTYLIACVFYSVVTGRNPAGLTATILDEQHKPDEPLEMIRLSVDDAAYLQRVAWRTVLSDPFVGDRPAKAAADAKR